MPRSTINGKVVDPRKTWIGRMPTNLPYANVYQKSTNHPLSYMQQNYWQRRGYGPSLWNNVPIDDVPVSLYYRPGVTQSYSLWGNGKSRNTLQNVESYRSNVDEDEAVVEGRIQEYYDQRLNKNRNKWMFKPVQGTSGHLKEIFIGRCWDFVTNKGKYLQNRSKVDCRELWKAFLKSFAFKGPCEVTFDDYTPFFNMYEEKPLNDRVHYFSV